MARAVRAPVFGAGQIVQHRRFGYRGVVIQADPGFRGTDEWYDRVAESRPPKDGPWYRVLVDSSPFETYVAERHLEADLQSRPVRHPLLRLHFDALLGGRYVRTRPMN